MSVPTLRTPSARQPVSDRDGNVSQVHQHWMEDVTRRLSPIKQTKMLTVAVDFGNINATTRGSKAVTVSGAQGIAIGDFIGIISGPELLEDDIIFLGAKVTGADQITFTAYNPTAGAIDPASQNFVILWLDLT